MAARRLFAKRIWFITTASVFCGSAMQTSVGGALSMRPGIGELIDLRMARSGRQSPHL